MMRRSTFFVVLILCLVMVSAGVRAGKPLGKIANSVSGRFTETDIGDLLILHCTTGFSKHPFKSEFSFQLKENPDEAGRRFTIDDLLQYTPTAAVYVLNLSGIRGRHRFVDRTLLLAGSYVLMGSTVYSLKRITNVQRPDGTTFDSFPSGHTAIAFMGAEFLRQEYRHRSPWYGVAGYVVATATAGFRLYHKRHYVTDVLAGAVIGVAATQVAYAVYPLVRKWLFPGKEYEEETAFYLAPVVTVKGAGIVVGRRLKRC